MLEFASPRFGGDALLHEVLNDPDTGRRKLQQGSPPGSVKRVQQALYDLDWTKRIDPPEHYAENFVIGTYGPITRRTVLRYKTQYGIHFPPSAPVGSVDEWVGPRTLRRLDAHCVLLDEADAAIVARAPDVAAEWHETLDATTGIHLGTLGASRLASISGSTGPHFPLIVAYKRGVGAFVVALWIFGAYVEHGGPEGHLGFPLADAVLLPDGSHRQRFEGGTVQTTPDGPPVVDVIPRDPPPPDPASF